MYTAILKPEAKDINGKDLSEFVGVEFNCYLHKNIVIVRNHITKEIHEVEYKYIEIV